MHTRTHILVGCEWVSKYDRYYLNTLVKYLNNNTNSINNYEYFIKGLNCKRDKFSLLMHMKPKRESKALRSNKKKERKLKKMINYTLDLFNF